MPQAPLLRNRGVPGHIPIWRLDIENDVFRIFPSLSGHIFRPTLYNPDFGAAFLNSLTICVQSESDSQL
jgi:hypothetical protein